MKRWIVAILLALPLWVAAQDDFPTIRDEVREQGYSWRIAGPADDFFLATFDQLVERSDLIIRGRVIGERTRLDPGEMTVVTDYTIEVLQVFKDDGGTFQPSDRVVVTKDGGNMLVEGKPVRVDSPYFPPLRWLVPHLFFIVKGAYRGGEYAFKGSAVGALQLGDRIGAEEGQGQVVCDGRQRKRHPITKPFCGEDTENLIRLVREKTAERRSHRPVSPRDPQD